MYSHIAIHTFITTVMKDDALKNLAPLRALYFDVSNIRKSIKNIGFLTLQWRAQSVSQKSWECFTENRFLLLDAKVLLLKISTVAQYWFKLPGIFKTENIPNE